MVATSSNQTLQIEQLKVSEDGPVELEIGKICGKRWKIIDKLGEGGCGSVYKVQDIHTMAKAALKAESNFVAGGSVLKLEVEILKRLDGRRYVAQLLQAAKKAEYSYMVMTLFGQSLNTLLRRIHECSVSTQVRVGINILYGLKQLHEVGYVHRDIKPANLAIGRRGQETRIIHMLDFGLAREYVIRSDGTVKMRIPRTGTLFRGTTRYCSANAHTRSEQGRPDDLWSMVYVLAEMRGPLPWDRVRYSDPYDWEKSKYSHRRRSSRRRRRSTSSITSNSSVDSLVHLFFIKYEAAPQDMQKSVLILQRSIFHSIVVSEMVEVHGRTKCFVLFFFCFVI
ncbi:Putative serine/threonine-protein kinase K06H7.1 [Toxocara canis]|uniref:Putative serine/threonine-protein kinase K06H7.1 n=1 Tax=Toxocara canis TaxID=6265 RepID=A0A0B2VKM5_TOXCA|nr:Putative serine/threonine-protein kinase K06H7.1 [Toxocara canis]